MGLDVRVHVLDKHWNVKSRDLLDYLPYEFRFSFYPGYGELTYNGIMYNSDVEYDPRCTKVRGLMQPGEWAAIVQLKAVKEYMDDHKEDTLEAAKLYHFDDDDFVLVVGDQLYDNVKACDAPKELYGKDIPLDYYVWFSRLCSEDERKLREYSSVLYNALLTATMTDDLLPLLTGFRELYKL